MTATASKLRMRRLGWKQWLLLVGWVAGWLIVMRNVSIWVVTVIGFAIIGIFSLPPVRRGRDKLKSLIAARWHHRA